MLADSPLPLLLFSLSYPHFIVVCFLHSDKVSLFKSEAKCVYKEVICFTQGVNIAYAYTCVRIYMWNLLHYTII